MATTTFEAGTVITSDWLNDVNAVVYAEVGGSLSASSIVNTPAGSITAVDVQNAINELDDEKQPLDADLTAIAALTTAAYGISLLETSSEAAFKALVNLEVGTDVQAYSTNIPTVAPGTSGNLITSNGSAWTSAAPNYLGSGQVWADYTGVGGRASGATMNNGTSKPIMVAISTNSNAALVISVAGVTVLNIASVSAGTYSAATVVVPAGANYVVTCTSISIWAELR